jgi:hypothetical protein
MVKNLTVATIDELSIFEALKNVTWEDIKNSIKNTKSEHAIYLMNDLISNENYDKGFDEDLRTSVVNYIISGFIDNRDDVRYRVVYINAIIKTLNSKPQGISEIKESCVVNVFIDGNKTKVNCYGKSITKYSEDECPSHINTYGWYLINGKNIEITNPAFEVVI